MAFAAPKYTYIRMWRETATRPPSRSGTPVATYIGGHQHKPTDRINGRDKRTERTDGRGTNNGRDSGFFAFLPSRAILPAPRTTILPVPRHSLAQPRTPTPLRTHVPRLDRPPVDSIGPIESTALENPVSGANISCQENKQSNTPSRPARPPHTPPNATTNNQSIKNVPYV